MLLLATFFPTTETNIHGHVDIFGVNCSISMKYITKFTSNKLHQKQFSFVIYVHSFIYMLWYFLFLEWDFGKTVLATSKK